MILNFIHNFQMHGIQAPQAIFVTEPHHVLGYCHVPKVASTLWMTDFAEMNHLPQNMIQKKLKSFSLHDHMFSKFSLFYPKDEDRLSKLFNFAFIRHPFERLVSAFHDKFITIKQLNLMEPFLKYYIKINAIQDKLILKQDWVDRHVKKTFGNFVLLSHLR